MTHPLDLLTFGEALAEVMRTEKDVPLHTPGDFTGPYPSGAPFIFAVQAARLGARAGAIGCVGATSDGAPDAFARNLLHQLDQDGVDTRGVLAVPGYTTGVAFIAYEGSGARDYVFHLRHAASGQLHPSLLDSPQIGQMLDGLGCLHIMGTALSMHDEALALGTRLLEMAQDAGAVIAFDPNLRPQLISMERARIAFAPFVAAADVILPTAEEAMLLTGDSTPEAAAHRLIAGRPGRIVVMTQGERGCTVYTEAGATHVPGFAVQEIDPTGAGDCFDAGFLVRWLAGDSPVTAARWGNACGALAVTRFGPMAGACHTDDVERFMHERIVTS